MWVTLSYLNATFSSQWGHGEPFWLKTNKILKYGKIVQILGPLKTENFPNIWLNSVFFNKNLTLKDHLTQKSQTSTRKVFEMSNLQSGLDMAYRPQRVNRLFVVLHHIFQRNQDGLRKGWSTTAQILSLQSCIGEINNVDKGYTIIFNDFKDTFSYINRDAIIETLAM